MEREALTLDNLATAMAAKNSGGFVIAQVERIAAAELLNPREVQVPGVLIDCVVVASSENHLQTYGTAYNHAFSGGSVCRLTGLRRWRSMSGRSLHGDAPLSCHLVASST